MPLIRLSSSQARAVAARQVKRRMTKAKRFIPDHDDAEFGTDVYHRLRPCPPMLRCERCRRIQEKLSV